jgi:hypothetical protein
MSLAIVYKYTTCAMVHMFIMRAHQTFTYHLKYKYTTCAMVHMFIMRAHQTFTSSNWT